MPAEQDLIELALKQRLLTRKQAELIREDLAQSGEDAGAIMLRRQYVTADQLNELLAASGAPARPAAPPAAPAAQPPTAGAPPGRQLSVADLRAGAVAPSHRNPVAAAGKDPDAPAQAPVQAPKTAELQRGGAGGPAPAASPAPAPAAPAASAAASNMPKTLAGFLRLARHWGASDLHLSTGRAPFVRLNGQIRYLEMDALTPERSAELNFAGLTEEQRKTAVENWQLDFSLEIPGVGRYRCNLFKQRLGWDGVYRIIRSSVPTPEELGLPSTVRGLTEYHQGLVMITGSGGAGKTTTAVALLDIVNQSRKDHIITVEDPIEYLLSPKKCQVTQREVGRHTQSFANALRAALREDPDIILVGEMRDHETTSIAISAAETGHLVFGTMTSSSATRTVARIVDMYPVTQQSQVCTMVAESLRGVITQQLLPRRDGTGVVLAVEVMINTSGIGQQIKEGKTHMIGSMIQGGKKYGMCLMDDSFLALLKAGVISGQEAYRRAGNKAAFEATKNDP